MRRYLVFGGAAGDGLVGWDAYRGAFGTSAEAIEEASTYVSGAASARRWAQVVDTIAGAVVVRFGPD